MVCKDGTTFGTGKVIQLSQKRILEEEGKGKITYHMLSGAASVFALSNQYDSAKRIFFLEMYYKYL